MWQSWRNRLDFGLRNRLRWSRGLYCEPAELIAGAKDELFRDDPVARGQMEALEARYALATVQKAASRERYLETLSCLAWLDFAFEQAPGWFESRRDSVRWLDVGAKNWAYVGALEVFTRARLSETFQLDGIELDPYRRYANLHTRADYARAFIREIPQARYHEGNVLDWRESAEVISHFLPFVFPTPLLAWGLPLDEFRPEALLRYTCGLLSPGGVMLIVNQGPDEAEAQQALLAAVQPDFALDVRNLGQLPTPFIQYRYPRYGWLIRKTPEPEV